MFRNYLKIAYRNLVKYKFISFINLFGLTIGLTCCLLILTYILNELSYDKYHPNAGNIYRVTRLFRNAETGATNLNLSTVAPPFGPLLQNDFPEIQKMTRLYPNGNVVFQFDDKIFNETDSYFADEHLADIFKIDMLRGDPRKGLEGPFSVMLSEPIAKKYFGNTDAMDKLVRLDNRHTFKVTGVYRPFPTNTHIHPSILVSFNTLKDSAVYGAENLRTDWGNNSFLTYVVLPEKTDIKRLESRFPAFLDKHMDEGAPVRPSKWTQLSLQRLTDIHLYSHMDYEAEENGDIKRVYIFSAIALFILLIACINYMNLSTARSALRAREIGIRKVVGAQRKELVAQFLSESVVICFIAILAAFALTALTLPWLSGVSGVQLSFSTLLQPVVLVALALAPIVVGVVSGLYPALFLSSFRPVLVLKGLFKAAGANISFRQVLVTAQFAISIILIISTGVVFSQLRYMQRANLGFDKAHIVTLPYVAGLNGKFDAFRNDLLTQRGVVNVARSSRIPSGRLLDAQGSKVRSGDSMAPISADIKFVTCDENFLPTYGVRILSGRGFSKDFGNDSGSFLINEAAVKVLNIPSNDKAIGNEFEYGGRKGRLVGVFNDFHFESMHQSIVPLVLYIPQEAGNFGNISVKISGSDIPSTLAHLEKVWKHFLPETPYNFTFLDERFAKLYTSEQRQGVIFTVFAGIAILIACLGLFGLSSFTITQRIKEIGIRKVLGASATSIVSLVSKDFMKLVGIAAVIAFAVAWYAMSKWLQDFAYRIGIPWWIFIAAGVVAALVALLTISFQAIRAANANPVKSLRTE